ncbi:uncharacterized protein CLUP02_00616 [Colletotrichum lupini]|uniref:Nephrocystin 3-like N-terminal domain-containing protein n=1 Tax=Colletotrichum lupini TaxID=145971 RepID=A0A9Q8SAQ5_9PEZI|nr:uncharacterized protein CLUP02_00616 [Colletotrichum lupini]UQC73969.1 hypothetical protein CLUP02_00616 [Colletotrichum lupini]
MSDPLSIAGSIAGIVQLSASVFQQASKFIKDAKGAEKTGKDLADQTRNLSGVLQNLSLLASSLEEETSISAFKAHHLHACRQTLLAVEKRLDKPLSGFTKEGLLAQSEGHRSTVSLALSTDTLESMLECLEKIEYDERHQKIIDYSMKVKPQINLQTSSRLRQPLTGLWLTESNPTFFCLKWADLPRSGLWLSRIPGAGKTILSGMVIEKILQKSSQLVAVAFFYCGHKNINIQKLLNQNHEAFGILEEYHARLKSASGLNAEPEPKDLLDLILTTISVYEKVFIVLDGLDERGDNVAEVAEAIKFLFEASSSASIAIAAHTQDLDIYIRAEMAHRRQPHNLSIPNPLFAEEIRYQLVNGAQGITNRARREALTKKPLDGRLYFWEVESCQDASSQRRGGGLY